jgi:tRNA threonylcarbamoyl adenosine modification protein YjeE
VTLEIRTVGPESAEAVRDVVREAFEARPLLDPPPAALTEDVEELADLLAKQGGLLAYLDGRAVGALVLDPIGSTMYLRRFGVSPTAQGHGIAARLIDAAVDASAGFDDLTVVAREELPATIGFWERRGFREIRRYSPFVELRRPLRTFVYDVPDAEAMRALGEGLAAQLRAGDLVVLSGELGAGKTTFTQGIGSGLGVRGDVTSPTFVIAREHPSTRGGPALVHVDAYRLGGIDELDDLDLDTSLDDAVTVVEWGEGIAEGLAESRLEIRIIRALAHPDEHADLDPRRVLMTPVGPRWYEMEVPDSHRPPLAEKVNENLLLDFRVCAEADLDHLDPAIPLRQALVVAEHEGRVLLALDSWSEEWELPGGVIGEGETPRQTVLRELAAGSGADPGTPELVGVATIQLGHERRIELIAMYRAALPEPVEGDGLTWWDPAEELADLSPIDAHLARVALDRA